MTNATPTSIPENYKFSCEGEIWFIDLYGCLPQEDDPRLSSKEFESYCEEQERLTAARLCKEQTANTQISLRNAAEAPKNLEDFYQTLGTVIGLLEHLGRPTP
jgi:hypothetical protein